MRIYMHVWFYNQVSRMSVHIHVNKCSQHEAALGSNSILAREIVVYARRFIALGPWPPKASAICAGKSEMHMAASLSSHRSEELLSVVSLHSLVFALSSSLPPLLLAILLVRSLSLLLPSLFGVEDLPASRPNDVVSSVSELFLSMSPPDSPPGA